MSSGKGIDSSVAEETKSAIETLAIKEHTIPWRWVNENHYLPSISSEIVGRFESFPYARAWVNWMVTSSVKRVFFLKPSRISYTKTVAAAWVCLIADRGRKVCVWRPNDGSSDEFVKTEIDPLFNVVPVLGEKIVGGYSSKNNPSNTNRYKEFLGTIAYFRGGKTPNNYAALGVTASILDELDRFPRNVGGEGTKGEGSPVYLAWKRTEASIHRKLVAGSTPTIIGESQIAEEFERCEHKAYRHLPCQNCSHMHPLEWQNFKFKHDEDGGLEVWFVCPKCSHAITMGDYAEMDEKGAWITQDGLRYDEDEDYFIDKDGKIVHEIENLGVYIWGAYSYLVTWKQIAREFLDAAKAMKDGDESLMITFTNQVRALAYRPRRNSKTVEVEDLQAGIEDYGTNSIPDKVAFLTAGMDVQTGSDARVEIIVAGWSEDGKEAWHIMRAIVKGNVDNQTTQDDINYILQGTYHTVSNKTLRIKCALIDEGDGNVTDEVRRYVGQMFGMEHKSNGNLRLIFRTYKGTDRGVYLHPYKEFKDRKSGTTARCHFVNHIAGKDALYKAAADGRIHFNNECNEDYFKQFTAERRVMRRINGILKVKYEIKREGLRAEVLDCWNMAQAAKELYAIIKW